MFVFLEEKIGNCEYVWLLFLLCWGDAHGCPFRHWHTQDLSARLTKYGFENYQIQEILNLVRNHKYQVIMNTSQHLTLSYSFFLFFSSHWQILGWLISGSV
jgi:hypothetical protein